MTDFQNHFSKVLESPITFMRTSSKNKEELLDLCQALNKQILDIDLNGIHISEITFPIFSKTGEVTVLYCDWIVQQQEVTDTIYIINNIEIAMLEVQQLLFEVFINSKNKVVLLLSDTLEYNYFHIPAHINSRLYDMEFRINLLQ